jgi:GTPase SAR1 family protein
MGACLNKEKGQIEDKGSQEQINAALSDARHEERSIHKLLLLGAGESGKSTLFKQINNIYGRGFSEKEKKSYISIIYRNTVASIEELCKQSIELPKNGDIFSGCIVTDPSTKAAMQAVFDMKYEDGTMPSELVASIKTLWADSGIQKTYSFRSKYQLNDSTSYFLDKLEIISGVDYTPSTEDVLRARIRTTGIVENDFTIEHNRFRMFDVGGQRNERKKWIHCFQDVTAVIFVVAISAYNQVLYEDENVNRMEESLNLFENICNSRWFKDTSIILFLNKSDLFREKIKTVPLTVAFPEFRGAQTYEATTAFIEQEFLKRNHYKKPIYCHLTCATDTHAMNHVFNGVKDIVVRGALETAGLI